MLVSSEGNKQILKFSYEWSSRCLHSSVRVAGLPTPEYRTYLEL